MNPYMPYREPPPPPGRENNNFANILAALKLGLDAYGTYQTGEIADRKVALTEQENLMKGQQFAQTQATEQEKIGIMREGQNIDREKVSEMRTTNRMKAGESPDLKNFGAISAKMAEKHFTNMGLKKDSPIVQEIQAMGVNPEITNGEAYRILKQNYPVIREEMIQSFSDDYTNKILKDQNYATTTEGKTQLATIEGLEKDLTGDQFLRRYFPGTIEAIQQKTEKAAKEAYIPPEKPVTPSFDQVVAAKVANGEISQEDASRLLHPQTPATGTPSSSAVTEKGNFPIWTNPADQSSMVVKPDGTKEAYDPRIHGRSLSKTLNQTTIYNQAVKETEKAQTDSRVKSIGDAIISGKQPPTIQGFGMAKLAAPLKEYLAKQDFDLTNAEADWIATKKHVQSMNSTQQLRLMQAVTFTRESIPIIRDLATQWDGYGFAPLNSVNLLAARNGVYGKEAASIATRMEAQIADLTSELGTVYKGGNSSTDESLKLAAQNIKAKWSAEVLADNLDQIEKNLTLRENSMKHSTVKGLSANSVYTKPPPASGGPTGPPGVLVPGPAKPKSKFTILEVK